MPLTLYRYILKDIIKMIAISTAALVSVLSFAMAIKPLSDGLLDFGGLLKFIGATAPTMLVYALPFSAAFAVTLSFSRLAADSEITACSASGLSYFVILLPVGLLGAALMVFLFVMSNWVLPPFNQAALSLIQKDIMRVLVHQLKKGDAVVLGNYKIFASQAEEVPPPRFETGLQPDQLVLLRGVAVGRLDPDTQQTLSDHTAEAADILVFRDGGRTWVQFRLKNPVYHDEGASGVSEGSLDVGANQAEMLPNIELPNRFKDKPRTMTWGELVEISRDPQVHPVSIAERQKLIEALLDAELLRRVETSLTENIRTYTPPQPGGTDGELRGLRMNGAREQEYFILSAPALIRKEDSIIITATTQHPLRIDQYEQGRLSRRYESRGESVITTAPSQPGSEPRITIQLKNASIIDPRRPDRATELSSPRISRLWWPQELQAAFDSRSTFDLLALAKSDFAGARAVARSSKTLSTHISRLVSRVISEFHERAATAFGCLLATVLGAALSIYLRGRVPLVVYFWTFAGVLAMTLILQTGSRLAADPSHSVWSGLAILWASTVAMAGTIGYLYAQVSKN